MELNFFGILDLQSFKELSETEQKALLIEKNIYINGKSEYYEFSKEEYHTYRVIYDYPTYLGQDFENEGVVYKLNDDFLNEVFKECVDYIKLEYTPIIEKYLETLKIQVDVSGEDFITEQRKIQIDSFNETIGHKIFKKLHSIEFENEKSHFEILKKYLSIKWFDLADYLFGFQNIPNFHIITTYCNYIKINSVLKILNSNNAEDVESEVDNKKISRPKFIAMLNELGFFQMSSMQDLSIKKKAQLVLALLQQDYKGKNIIHNVEKNIQSLNSDSEIDNQKFTAWTHMEAVEKVIYEIKNK